MDFDNNFKSGWFKDCLNKQFYVQYTEGHKRHGIVTVISDRGGVHQEFSVRKIQNLVGDWYVWDGNLVHSGFKNNVIKREDGVFMCSDCGTLVPDEVMTLFQLEKFRSYDRE